MIKQKKVKIMQLDRQLKNQIAYPVNRFSPLGLLNKGRIV